MSLYRCVEGHMYTLGANAHEITVSLPFALWGGCHTTDLVSVLMVQTVCCLLPRVCSTVSLVRLARPDA